MLSFEMLDVAIGMILVYLLISLACTALNELIEAKLKLRAVDLEQGIRELLNDSTVTKPSVDNNVPISNNILTAAENELKENPVTALYNHPLIFSLFRGGYTKNDISKDSDPKNKRYKTQSDLPSYIPSRNFALALLNVFMPDVNAGSDINTITASVAKIPNEAVKKALSSIVTTAGNDINKIREGIENWYNSSMDRVSGWYKRRVQKIVFMLGIVLVIGMNADSIAIFNNLVNERPLRSAIVNAAQKITSPAPGKSSIALIKTDMDSLYQFNLPIGWNWKSDVNNNKKAIPNLKAIPAFDLTHHQAWFSIGQWSLKLLGWLITVLAISLGAPFWFDMLNRIMVVRSTVKPTEKSPDESSQDAQAKKS